MQEREGTRSCLVTHLISLKPNCCLSLLTLCSVDHKVIRELTNGNLVLATQQDDELHNVLETYKERSGNQPSIYARVRVSRSGSAMSVDDAQRLVRWLRRYVSEDPAIVQDDLCQSVMWRVDREYSKHWHRESTNTGSRRSLLSKSGTQSEDRVQVLKKFCSQLQAQCEASGDSSLLPRPLLYVGYALRADNRQWQHEACGASSNWLASLVQATCNVLWGRGAYRMHIFVVCLLCEEDQGPVAEMLLTRVPGAYYHGGSGFCIDIAGKSMESIHFRKLTHKEARNRWAEFDEWVDQNTPRNKNWEAEAAVAAAEAEARRQRGESREKVLNERAERFLGGSAMCVELRSNPAWSTLPTEIKNDMEDVERIVQRFGEAVKQEEEREKASESGG